MVAGEVLEICHIQRCATDLICFQRLDQSTGIDMLPATNVDDIGALLRQNIELLLRDDIRGSRRQRQSHEQHVLL